MTTTAFVLLGLGAFVTLANWSFVVNTLITKKSSSFVLLAGGVLTFVGCALLPAVGWKLGLFALVIDPGCWILAFPIVWLVRRFHAEKKAVE